MSKILFILLIILVVFLSIGTSLQFGLNGDDWQQIYFYKTIFKDFSSFFNLNSYTTNANNYTFAQLLMGFIYQLFSFNPFPYYLISIILRIIATLSFYPAVYSATKNKLAAFLSSVFFASMFAGIETTNWVFNMNTYLSISLLNLFIFLYFKNEFKAISVKTALLGLLLLLAFFVAPTRMHGLLFFIPLAALIKIKNFSKMEILNVIARSIILYLPIFILRLTERASKDTNYLNDFSQILSYKGNALAKLVKTISNTILPDRVLTSYVSENTKAVLIILLYAFLTVFFLKIWKKNPQFAKFGLLTLSLPIIFLIIPWLISPGQVLSSDQRYLIVPAAYLFCALALLFSFLWKQKNQLLKGIAFTLPLIIITINIFALRQYLNLFAKNGRLTTDINKQFEYLNSEIKDINANAPVVFLFIPDNPSYLYNAITFGFTYHMMLTNPNFTLDFQKSPFPADNMDSLLNVLGSKDSSELHRYGYDPVQIPLENVYIFKLENKTLTNITGIGREELKKKLPNLN